MEDPLLRFGTTIVALLSVVGGPLPAAAEQMASLGPDLLSEARAGFQAAGLMAPDTPAGSPYVEVVLSQVEAARDSLLEVYGSGVPAEAELVRAKAAFALHALDSNFGRAAPGRQDYGALQATARATDGLKAGGGRLLPGDQRVAEALACLSAAEGHIREAVDLGRAALVTPSDKVAHEAVRGMLMALGRAVDGWDRDGNGKLDWQQGEGGLGEAAQVTRSLAQALALR